MKKKGFTIIELVVVISIIALLIGIMAPGLKVAVRQARELKQKGQFKLHLSPMYQCTVSRGFTCSNLGLKVEFFSFDTSF